MPILNKDMSVCISLSERPSNLGTRFHNFLYEELGLNFIYKAFSTDDIEGAIRGMRALGLRGCSVSMPFKEDVMALVDEIEPSAAAIESVNTIVNESGRLIASNTDYEAIAALLSTHRVDPASRVVVRGSGGMAKAVVAAFRDAGFHELTVFARNAQAGGALAEKYGFVSTTSLTDADFDVIVNVTPIGMSGDDEEGLSFAQPFIDRANVVFDVVAFPAETPLITAARRADTAVITGAEVIALQAARQFEKYTGHALTNDQVARASAFSRMA